MIKHGKKIYGSFNIVSKKINKSDKRSDRFDFKIFENQNASEAFPNFMNMFINQANQEHFYNNNRVYFNYQNRFFANKSFFFCKSRLKTGTIFRKKKHLFLQPI